MKRIPLLLILLLALTVIASAPAHPGHLAPGTVVSLAGTPHLWIADEHGVLHWAGDTRALADKYVNWNDRREVPRVVLQHYFTIGDPWLSAGLLKDGDPIYLVKWETDWWQPTLLHIQSLDDLTLFGIDSTNYGDLVLDRFDWEYRYRMRVTSLPRGSLPAVVPGPTLTPTPIIRRAPPTPWPTRTLRPQPTWPPSWRPSPTPIPEWVQPAQSSSGVWVVRNTDRSRMRIEVLSHKFEGSVYVVTVHIHNLQSDAFYPDSNSIQLRVNGNDGRRYTTYQGCTKTLRQIANKIGKVLWRTTGDVLIPAGGSVVGDLHYCPRVEVRSLELVPHVGIFDGPALRVR